MNKINTDLASKYIFGLECNSCPNYLLLKDLPSPVKRFNREDAMREIGKFLTMSLMWRENPLPVLRRYLSDYEWRCERVAGHDDNVRWIMRSDFSWIHPYRHEKEDFVIICALKRMNRDSADPLEFYFKEDKIGQHLEFLTLAGTQT